MKQKLPSTPGPIGVFDSGYGGLTILSKIREALPEYDYIFFLYTSYAADEKKGGGIGGGGVV